MRQIEATKVTAYATVILAVSTFILAIFVGNQTNLMRDNYDINNRPWIAGDQVRVFEDQVLYDIQNFGSIPNEHGELKFYVIKSDTATSPFPRNMLLEERFKTQPLSIVMPSQKMSLVLSGDLLTAMQEVRDSGGYLQLLLILNYGYGVNNDGEYGFMGKFDPQTNDFHIIETWAR